MSNWRGVPKEHRLSWRNAFEKNSASIFVSVLCPCCAQSKLYRWHDGSRGLWEWCQNCLIYEHSQALVPKGWSPEVIISPEGVTAEPTQIVVALKEIGIAL
jgi:hypothetical protein